MIDMLDVRLRGYAFFGAAHLIRSGVNFWVSQSTFYCIYVGKKLPRYLAANFR
jgi:hypothetical protein